MGEPVKRIAYLDLSLELREDGRYYVVRSGDVISSAPSESIGRAYLELAEEQILEADPSIKNPKDMIAKERQTREIMSMRAQSAAIGKTKATAKGGKGGRSGV